METVTALIESDAAITARTAPSETATSLPTALQDWNATRADATRGAATTSQADEPFAAGAFVAGRYRIEQQLGRGGMGVVYRAFDERLKLPVALKCLPRSLSRDPRRLEQFHNEVRLARQISHANVCRVHDIGEANGQLFLSMEYIDGRDLAATLLARGPFAEAEAVELLRGICAGLSAVHAQGILHRDLKPANIMINRAGQPQLMDFGIAGATVQDEGAERITEGTIAYMAPEQLRGGDASVQSDLYAFGHVMFEVLTGRRLFSVTTLDELRRQQDALPAKMSAELSGVADRIQDVVRHCLDPNPAKRPASVSDVIAMLQVVLLDASSTIRRLVQLAEQLFVALPFLGLLNGWGDRGTFAGIGALWVVIVLFVEWRFPLGWTVPYKGHVIRVQNHAFLGERLSIDGKLVDRGRLRMKVTLRGTIEGGAGAGERITAETTAGVFSFSCRVVAQAFGG